MFLSKLIYAAGIQAMGLGVRLAAPFHAKAAMWVAGRENLLADIQQKMEGNTAPVVWFHCASVGEFEQGRPLMEAFRQEYPEYKILLTFFSPSGYNLRKNYPGADYIFYLPLDTSGNARHFIALTKPVMAIFIKYEYWHYFTRALKYRHIPLFSVSAIFRPNQIYFKPWGGFYRHIIERFTNIYTQDQASAQLLFTTGYTKVSAVGDTRVDRVLQNAASAAPNHLVQTFKGQAPCFVIGSSWPQDVKVLLAFMESHLQEIKFVLAPHEIKETDLQEIEKNFIGQTARYSTANPESVHEARILLIDNVGMLAGLYQYADYAYVGGAFGAGLHNILEPAAFGPPIFFGTKYAKFQEAKDLIEQGVAFSVASTEALDQKFQELQASPEKRGAIRKAAAAYLQKQAGATARILAALDYWLPSRQA